MYIYPFPCPSCNCFGVQEGKLTYRQCKPGVFEAAFTHYQGDDCLYCPQCEWHSETDSQKHERLYGEAERAEKRLLEIEKALKVVKHDTWRANVEASDNSHELYQMKQRGY